MTDRQILSDWYQSLKYKLLTKRDTDDFRLFAINYLEGQLKLLPDTIFENTAENKIKSKRIRALVFAFNQAERYRIGEYEAAQVSRIPKKIMVELLKSFSWIHR